MKTKFNNLTMADKAWLIHEFGDLLMSVEYYDHRINLFSLNGQFIELFLNIGNRKIEKIEVASYESLDKYLSRISLGKLKQI